MDDFEKLDGLHLNTDVSVDDDLPDLPSRRDADTVPDEDEQDAYLHPEDADLDEYLSYDEYEQQDEAEPQPARRHNMEVFPEKKKGGLFGFLKKRGAEEKVPEAAPVNTDGQFPDSDPAVDYPDDAGYSYEGGGTAYDASADRGRLYATHSGARGKAEQEARELIASIQAESGAAKRDRRTADEHRVDLNDLLDITTEEGEKIHPLPQAPKAPDENEYRFNLDEAMDIDADVKQYTGKHSAPPYTPDAQPPEIDSRFNLGGQNTKKTMSYGETEVDMSADEDYVPAQQTGYSPSQWTPDYDDPLAERQDTEEPPRKQHRGLFGRRRRAPEPEPEAEPEAPAQIDPEPEAEEVTDTAAGPAIYAVDAAYRDDPDYVVAPHSIDNTDSDDDDDDFDDYDDESSRKYHESDLYVPPSFREYLLSILASVWLKLRGTNTTAPSCARCATACA